LALLYVGAPISGRERGDGLLARKKEFRIDLHVHSLFSGESPTTPEEIVDSAIRKGLDGVCITEHGSLYASAPFEKFRKSGLVILRGVEVSTSAGHMLVYGVDEVQWNDWGLNQTVDAQELVTRAKELGGIAVVAHPWQLIEEDSFLGNLAPVVDDRFRSLKGLAAIEVCNGKSIVYPLICESLGYLARRLGLGCTGGSDAHFGYQVGRSYTVFREPIFSSLDLVQALATQDYYPQNAF